MIVGWLDPFAFFLLFLGALLLIVAASAQVFDWIVGSDADDVPIGAIEDREPTDDEIYNGPGREGGIVYDQFDEPGSLGEHDWRL